MASLVDQAKLDASQIGFQTRFNMALQAVDDPARQLAMEIPSSSAVENHNWLGAVPQLSEWLDQRKIDSLRAESYTLANKNWSSGIQVDMNDIADDRLGIVMPRIDQLGVKAALHYGDLLVQALIAGFTLGGTFGNAYDGLAFFSATHQDGDGPTQSNTSSNALTQANYFTAREAMWSLTDERSDPLGIVPNTLVVGPSLEEIALQITQAELIPNGAGTASQTNVARGTARVVISPRLVGAAASHWFLADLSQPVRPLMLQIREPISSSFLGESSEQAFMNRTMVFGAQARHAVGFGLWQHIYGSNA